MTDYNGRCSSCGATTGLNSYKKGRCCYARAMEIISEQRRQLEKIQEWVNSTGPAGGALYIDTIKGNYGDLKKLVESK